NLEPAPSGTETETWISESPPAPTRRASTRPFLATLALFALGAVGVAAWYHSQRAPEAVPPPPRPLEQATLQSQEQSTDTPQAEPAATAAAGSTELAQAPPPEAPSPALLPTLQRPPRHMVAPPPQPVSKASADQASASQPRSVLDER
ncbi:MAG: hypothetical protein KC492_31215, partial [Myxococcales bacterium]|nr:hypothetical protein [Myxococcales bacterium]